MSILRLYYYSLDDLPEKLDESIYMPALDEKELERYDSTINSNTRLQLLLSRWLLKSLLSESTKKPLAAHRFLYTENGKPYIDTQPEIHFSLAHCNTSIAIAIADTPVGVDVENNQRKGEPWEQIHRFFNVDVGHRMQILESLQDKKQFFFTYWTAMEAMVKMKGSKVANERKFFARKFELKHDDQYLDSGEFHLYLTKVNESEHLTVACEEAARDIQIEHVQLSGTELIRKPLSYPEAWNKQI